MCFSWCASWGFGFECIKVCVFAVGAIFSEILDSNVFSFFFSGLGSLSILELFFGFLRLKYIKFVWVGTLSNGAKQLGIECIRVRYPSMFFFCKTPVKE